MKIMISGSMRYSREMQQIKRKLTAQGHHVDIPYDTDAHIKNPKLVDDLDANTTHVKKHDIIRESFNLVAQADSILVLNFERNNIPGYIGVSTLMEIGLAYFLRKQIFLYNSLPSQGVARFAHEVSLMNPIIINGDISKITE